MESPRVVIGAHIRKERERRKVTMGQLARAIGVSVPFMSDAEHGRRGLTPERLGQIATYLGLDIDKLETLGGYCPACRGTGRR
jgi:transcriptional regulator with XRE-family HTH domain